MPGMRDIKRRIRSVRNTQQITRAMKMVSASKLRRCQGRLVQYRPYGEAHQHMVQRVITHGENLRHPLFEANESGPVLLLMMTSDKGLCGSFNQNIIRQVEHRAADLGKDRVALYAIGRKGRDHFRKRGYTIWKYLPMASKERDPYDIALAVGSEIITAFLKQEFSAVEMVYSFFRSALIQSARREELIPLKPQPESEEYPQQYLFEPSAQAVLEVLMPMSIKLAVYRAILETNAAEHGARMTSMESATNNAVEMIASLTLSYNKARQAAITKELIEVVSGADALK